MNFEFPVAPNPAPRVVGVRQKPKALKVSQIEVSKFRTGSRE